MFNLPPVAAAHLFRELGTKTRPLRSALELRYQVYCVEYSFLEPEDYPDGAETDEHDDEAAHFHAFDGSDELVGYVRLVRPDAEQRFPLQRHCGNFAAGLALPNPKQAAEISRLMVRSEFRRQRGQRLAGVTAAENNAILSGQRRLDTPQILLGLYKQMYLYSLAHGIRYWYAAMERPLARSLARSGFVFEPIGPETDYYGPVSPYLADLNKLEASVGTRHPDLLAWLRNPTRSPAPLASTPLAN
ncbi:PEP-CTERM/exosortase system-associated acyltransferase [Pelomonas cellulosilytica]|uniref:PEP-CTERM/exosortase system-associated acyltransferase n=1 Tax=Pelomonas cellulosilytica TaxID=2906762 RepID=A0ABS8Y1K7_9BURK|nr:PEP-CTERM/exosortase system-associated acyltransferase [Pelomonas sp. P8]MCE4557538.1 PEP-CTERM/exosortase system-associated acyltransferase [Pelomonas sp. P8]